MAKIPKQRGGGQSGNTSWGHRSNRVSSIGRGGNPHAGGGGGGKSGGCAVVVLASVALVLTGLGAGVSYII